MIDIKNLDSEEVARELEKSMNKKEELGIDQLDPKASKKIMRIEKMKRFPDGTIILKEMMRKSFDWDFNKMVDDENTAYDEVARDLANIVRAFIVDEKAEKLALEKLEQLMRLLGDEL